MSFKQEFSEKLAAARTTITELKYFSDSVLHEPCTDTTVEEGIAIGKKLEDVLSRYRTATGVGRGLAAPQIGISKRVFVTYVNDQFRTFINPRILNTFDAKNRYRELCMSAEGTWADIERPAVIEFTWTDEHGTTHTEFFETFMARLIQHEHDHLEGIVCLDKAIPGTAEPVSSNPLEEHIRPS